MPTENVALVNEHLRIADCREQVYAKFIRKAFSYVKPIHPLNELPSNMKMLIVIKKY